MALAPGTRLGPYEIVAPLGAGGMGEVYRARDPRLDREVAIKVLPPAFAADADRMRRFTQEAKAAGSLQHPNIVTVFDVGAEGGTAFVVQELVPGGSLRDRLARGALPLRDVLRLASGIAAGLAAAHEKGIVHRDLKPENVGLAAEGRPQVLDFGLARVSKPLEESGSRMETSAGMVIGTVGYMAPEQVRGEPADARADLFALGTMLHEMLSGARPFSRSSAVETLHAILTEEPPPLPAGVPPPVARIVTRCLEKDPKLRMQSARDLAFALDLAAGEDPRPVEDGAGGDAARSRRRAAPWAWAAVAAALAVAGFFAGRMTSGPTGTGSIRVSTLSQGNRDGEPAVSADGRLVAFSAVRRGGQGIWLMDMVTRSEVKLSSGEDGAPRFTPDGGSIVFSRISGTRPSLWRVPVIGGQPRLLLEDASDADVAPDGTRLAYVSGRSDSSGMVASLMVAKLDGSDRRVLWSLGSVVLSVPRWSPDGKRVALISSGSQNAPNALVVVDVATGVARTFPSPNGAVLSSPAWDGTGSGIVVAEGEGIVAVQRGASGRLFRVDARSGEYRPLGWLNDYPISLDLLPDGRLVLAGVVARQNLREVSLDDPDMSAGRWLTSGMAIDRQPVFSPGGESVLFSSNRGGTLDLWEVSVLTGEIHRVTDDPADDWDPAYSRDGQSIFWSSNRSGAFEIWTARRDGSAPRMVSNDSLDAENPGVTPDNSRVVYSSSNPAKAGLWSIAPDGSGAELLLPGSTLIPDLSPDGRLVSVLVGVGTPDSRLAVFDLERREVLPAAVRLRPTAGAVQIGRSRWTADGRAVVYAAQRANGQPVLARRPLAAWRGEGGATDTLFASTADAIESFGFSPDGRRAVVAIVDWLSGLTIADPVPGVVPPRRGK